MKQPWTLVRTILLFSVLSSVLAFAGWDLLSYQSPSPLTVHPGDDVNISVTLFNTGHTSTCAVMIYRLILFSDGFAEQQNYTLSPGKVICPRDEPGCKNRNPTAAVDNVTFQVQVKIKSNASLGSHTYWIQFKGTNEGCTGVWEVLNYSPFAAPLEDRWHNFTTSNLSIFIIEKPAVAPPVGENPIATLNASIRALNISVNDLYTRINALENNTGQLSENVSTGQVATESEIAELHQDLNNVNAQLASISGQIAGLQGKSEPKDNSTMLWVVIAVLLVAVAFLFFDKYRGKFQK